MNYRLLPAHAKGLLWMGLALAAGSIGYELSRLEEGQYDPSERSLILRLASTGSLCTIAWSLTWRDELEPKEGPRFGAAFAVIAAAELTFAAGIDWAAVLLHCASLAVLVGRNSLGLRVALLSGRLRLNRVLELGVACAALLGLQYALLGPQIEEHSGAKAVGLASLRCAASAASAVVAVAATSAERFPQINSGHMRNGCVLMLAWDLLSSMHMAMPAGTLLQVSVNSAEVALRAAALSYIATSAYRRTPCKPSIY